MNQYQEMVRQFHEAFDQPIGHPEMPDIPGDRFVDSRTKIMREEFNELILALEDGRIVDSIDGMCDLIYVVLGTAVAMGVWLEPFFKEVHRSNMTKVGGKKDAETGKWIKPSNYSPARISAILKHEILVARRNRLELEISRARIEMAEELNPDAEE